MSKRSCNNIMVTGGCGFIGSAFIRKSLNDGFNGQLVNIDSLTYAGRKENLDGLDKTAGNKYSFYQCDINDYDQITSILDRHSIDTIVHFAAESHVDRSINGPAEFIRTNINGTFSLLEAARSAGNIHFHHISTDEVYGSLGDEGTFHETTPYDPSSPYSASKASSDHLVRAYHRTYNMPVTLSNCSNNYGPFQYPEKLIPVIINNAAANKPLPVYGEGKNIRDWLYVDDHVDAIWAVLQKGENGRSYNVGGENEWTNLDLVKTICRLVGEQTGQTDLEKLITFVTDRPGHDFRYAIDCERIKTELGWKQKHTFEEGLAKTVTWYLERLDQAG